MGQPFDKPKFNGILDLSLKIKRYTCVLFDYGKHIYPEEIKEAKDIL